MNSTSLGRYIAIDCEMVGVGPKPDNDSVLARVSVVNYDGELVYDSFVNPREPVTDYRSHVSGIYEEHLKEGRSFEHVQAAVSEILQGRVLVGHAVKNDLAVLLLSHPKSDIRDTARHPPYRQLAGGAYPRLKVLASELLGLDIQSGEHSSIEDAQAAMLLFRRDKDAFERDNVRKGHGRLTQQSSQQRSAQSNHTRKSKKKKRQKK